MPAKTLPDRHLGRMRTQAEQGQEQQKGQHQPFVQIPGARCHQDIDQVTNRTLQNVTGQPEGTFQMTKDRLNDCASRQRLRFLSG